MRSHDAFVCHRSALAQRRNRAQRYLRNRNVSQRSGVVGPAVIYSRAILICLEALRQLEKELATEDLRSSERLSWRALRYWRLGWAAIAFMRSDVLVGAASYRAADLHLQVGMVLYRVLSTSEVLRRSRSAYLMRRLASTLMLGCRGADGPHQGSGNVS